MITAKGIKWIWATEHIMQNCLRSIEYANAVEDLEIEQWIFTRNCYIETIIINWWKIFGTCNESTNYTKFFGENQKLCSTTIPNLTSCKVLIRIINSTGLSEERYNTFHTITKKARNKFFAHYDLTKIVEVPDIEQMKSTCLEMRNILKEVVQTQKLDDLCTKDHGRMYDVISAQRSNEDLISGFSNGVKNFGRSSS